jgi:hypothetical protein
MTRSLTVLVPSASDEDVDIGTRASSDALSDDDRRGGQDKGRKSDFRRHD